MTALSGLRARLSAEFRLEAGGLRHRIDTEPPLELRGPFVSGEVPLYYLRNVTCGLMAGDRCEVDIRVEAGAKVQVAASSAARSYDMPAGDAEVVTRLEALSGSLLVFGPQPLILQGGTSLRQALRCRVHEGSSVLVAEVLSFGRLASGEAPSFRRFESELIVESACGEPAYEESYVIQPGASLDAALAGRGALVSFYALGASQVSAEALQAVCDRTGELAGCSVLPNQAGLVVKALAGSLSAGVSLCQALVDTVIA